MNDHVDLGRDMAELARSLSLPDSLDERLTAVTASAIRMISGADCADILLIAKGTWESVAATDRLPIELDSVQQQLDEGPCVEAAKSQPIVRCDDLRTDPRWPRFAAAAVESGVYSMLSLKLYTGKNTLGALNLFGFALNAFDSDDEDIGSMLATHAAIALLAARKDQQFESALASRDVIGQAKGMVMERYGLDAVRAFELLSALSQNSNVPLAAVAAQLVESRSAPIPDAELRTAVPLPAIEPPPRPGKHRSSFDS